MEIIILSILRFFVPLLIFRFPILGVLASMYLDFQDFNFFDIKTQQDMDSYQVWDKLFDTYYLSIAFLTSLSWKDKFAKKLSIFTFLYRMAGVIIFTFFPFRELFLVFPNLFENLFLFYNFFRRFTKKEKLFTTPKIGLVIILSIVIPKLFAEYYLHVLHAPSIFSLDRIVRFPIFPVTLEDFVLYSLYIGPTISVLIWRIMIARKS